MSPINIGLVREVLDYDPLTGVMRWRISDRYRRRDQMAGRRTAKGYLVVSFRNYKFLVHRIAFLIMTGAMPDVVDHINGIKTDNRWCNLRPSSAAENAQNQRNAKRINKVGLIGVRRRGSQFVADIGAGGRHLHLGTFGTAIEAHAAYVKAKRRLHPGCTI